MPETYRDFSSLVLHSKKGVDYRLSISDLGSSVSIVATHGGGIEPLTGELAKLVAGQDHNVYVFEGLRLGSNAALRIPPSRFDEMRLRALVKRGHTAVSLDGSAGVEETIHLGGKNRRLKRILEAALSKAGYEVRGPAGPGAAHDPARFYNQSPSGGVQIELSLALRKELVDCPLVGYQWQDPAQWNARFHSLADLLREAISEYQQEMNADPAIALERFESATEAFPPSIRSHRSHQHAHGDDNHQGQ